MGGSDQWVPQAPLKTHRDLIAVDLPGFGRNAHLPPIDSIHGYAEWVLDYLDSLGVLRFSLLGHSMGGMIVQEMVRQTPTRVDMLILYGTGPEGVLPDRFEPIETSIARARAEGSEATSRRIAATWFRDGEEAEAFPECAEIAARSLLPAIIAGLEAMRDWSGSTHLSKISAKTLVLWGERDRSYGWQQVELLWRGIPRSHLAVVPLCAHAVHLERPDLFNLILSEFLAGD